MKFADARTRPAAELLARVPLEAPGLVVDLGCGPGTSTELLQARWPKAQLIGVDSSEPMLIRARSTLPRVRFVQADVRRFRPAEPADVIFANAVLHWVPDHETVFPEQLSRLSNSGCLAVQMPDNWQEPSHRLMREVAQQYLPDLAAVKTHAPIKSAQQYYDLLAPRAKHLDIWQTRYQQVMPDAAAIVEWVKGSGLRPYLEAIAPEQQAAFLQDYEREVAQAYPARADGRRLFGFPRLFIVCAV